METAMFLIKCKKRSNAAYHSPITINTTMQFQGDVMLESSSAEVTYRVTLIRVQQSILLLRTAVTIFLQLVTANNAR